ncbi:MAG: NAD-dependent deacylase [Cyclobacteriaceae bacterium]|jgi:NAD-dependent deacetylase|nr:NAD-dependent deacylase [Cyclobacteriaceae bacterium]
MKKLVVLTGAGISAESGIPTFRDAGGLWEGHRVEDVASPEGWHRNPELVLDFYNQRRKKAREVQPNRGHLVLAQLEDHFNVVIVTQNVDDLHERAGSSTIIHLHGSLFESRSTADEKLIYPISGWELNVGDVCEKGSQLRPNIVWFGELVPMIEVAARHVSEADIFLVVGTSLHVYPAAGLIHETGYDVPKFLVDPNAADWPGISNLTVIRDKASTGMELVKAKLLELI